MKTLFVTALMMWASLASAEQWKDMTPSQMQQCLFGGTIYLVPNHRCGNHLPSFTGVGREFAPNSYDSGLGNYHPEYPYPYTTQTLEKMK